MSLEQEKVEESPLLTQDEVNQALLEASELLERSAAESTQDWMPAPAPENAEGESQKHEDAAESVGDDASQNVLEGEALNNDMAQFAMGAIDGDRVEAFQLALAQAKQNNDHAFMAEMTRYVRLMHVLAYAAPRTQPPSALLKQSLIEKVAAQSDLAQRKIKNYASRKPGWMTRIAHKMGWPESRLLKAIVMLCVCLTFLALAFAYQKNRIANIMQESSSLAVAERMRAETAERLAERRLTTVVTPDLHVTSLVPANQSHSEDKVEEALLLWSPFGRKGLLSARGLKKLPEGREYALWLRASGREHFVQKLDDDSELNEIPVLLAGRPRPIEAFFLVVQPHQNRDFNKVRKILIGNAWDL